MATQVDWDELDLRRSASGYAFDEDDDDLGDVPLAEDTGASDEAEDDEPARGGAEEQARVRALEAELAAERAARAETLKAQRATELTTLKAREEELRRQRRQASDEDDWDSFDKLDDELRQVAYKRMRLEEEPAEPAEATAERGPQLVPAARSWIKRNATWFEPGGERYDAKRAELARKLAAKLEQRYDLEDPELYRELDRQLKGQTRASRAERVAGNGRSLGTPPGQRRIGRPSPQEERSMRRYGFDPNNPRQVAQWRARDADLG